MNWGPSLLSITVPRACIVGSLCRSDHCSIWKREGDGLLHVPNVRRGKERGPVACRRGRPMAQLLVALGGAGSPACAFALSLAASCASRALNQYSFSHPNGRPSFSQSSYAACRTVCSKLRSTNLSVSSYMSRSFREQRTSASSDPRCVRLSERQAMHLHGAGFAWPRAVGSCSRIG